MHAPRVKEATQIQGLFLLFGPAIAAFFPFLALYLQEHHGLSASRIGIVIAFSAAARMVANPVWGHYADTRWGRLTVLQICLLGAAIAGLVLNIQWAFVGVVIAATVHSAFMVGQGSNVDAIALAHLGEDRMSEYGRIRGWESLTYAAACLCLGAVLQAKGMVWAMPIYAVAVFAVLAWTTTLERDRPTELEDHGRLGAVGVVFREAPRFWGFLAATLLVWTGFNAAWNFISLRIADQGGGALLVGLGTALGGLIELPTMRGSSRLQERFGLRKVYMLGCGVYALGFLLWGSVSDPTLLSALTMLEGIAFSLLFTTGVVIVGRLLPANLYSTGNAVTSMVGFGIGPIIGAGIGGWVYETAGPGVLYGAASALAVGAAVVAWFALNVPALDTPRRRVAGAPAAEAPVPTLPDTGPTV
ncbi:MAG TPA: MFS transporter [Actinomycetota bacterium]|nr:MFS transporter [Actinomycetota bacterium]